MTDAELGALMMTEARLNRAMNAAGDPDDEPKAGAIRDEWLQARIRRHAAVMARLLVEETEVPERRPDELLLGDADMHRIGAHIAGSVDVDGQVADAGMGDANG